MTTTATKTSPKKWICAVSIFITLIPTQLLICTFFATFPCICAILERYNSMLTSRYHHAWLVSYRSSCQGKRGLRHQMPNDNHIQAQNDIQLPDTGPSWTKCGLQFDLNPSKSARAWNITSLFWILFEGYLACAFCCCFKTCMGEEGAHARLRLCLEFYLNVTLRVHFSFAFKRIFVMHSFFFECYITRAFLRCFQTNIRVTEFLQNFCDTSVWLGGEVRSFSSRFIFLFSTYFVDQSCAGLCC